MILNFSEAYINKVIVHKVGNKSLDEGVTLSQELFFPKESMRDMLMHFCTTPFHKELTTYQFVNPLDGQEPNVVSDAAMVVFGDQNQFVKESQLLTNWLYAQSNHPHIKSGDLIIVLFGDVLYQDELIDAIGIFKSEDKVPFLQVSESEDALELQKLLGISLKKLDKGALILNVDEGQGFNVLSVDSNSYDAEYWLNYFLNVEYIKDDNYSTQAYFDACQSFARDVLRMQENGKKTELDFMNQAVAYFEENDLLLFDDFKNTVFESTDQMNQFDEYYGEYQKDLGERLNEHFGIMPAVIKKAKKGFKNELNLDTGIKIKLDFNNPDACRKFVEKAYDAKKQMSYYKVYFHEEL